MIIRLEQSALGYLSESKSDQWTLSALPVKAITEQFSGETLAEDEIAYAFFSQSGNILFRNINGIYQSSAITGDNKKTLMQYFIQICEANDINYTAIGFEPN